MIGAMGIQVGIGAHRSHGRDVRRLLSGVFCAGFLAALIGVAAPSAAVAAHHHAASRHAPAPAGVAGPEAGVGLTTPSTLQLADSRALGTHWVRMFATWADLEPGRGVFAQNWFAYYDQAFKQLPARTKVLLDVVGTPRWETGASDEHMPPANPNEYAAFVGAVARHFGGRVSAYEIWNEEDAPIWWTGGPNAPAYAELLKATYPVLKAAEPKATVIVGGLTGNDYSFVEEIYRAGAKGSFDAVGVHTDTACNISL